VLLVNSILDPKNLDFEFFAILETWLLFAWGINFVKLRVFLGRHVACGFQVTHMNYDKISVN